jgi:glutamine amidotransferase
MITIVDYGIITDKESVVADASKLMLPGVGAFDVAMNKIASSGLRRVLDHKALIEKIPVLGICLGMQLLTKGSEEGKLPGLGWIDAYTKKFPSHEGIKVPHMGWNSAMPHSKSKLNENLSEEPRFYFVHSYYVETEKLENSMMRTKHGIEFDSGINHNNIYGVQFHPEKSHKFGMQLFKNFSGI